jgi:dipeptidase E
VKLLLTSGGVTNPSIRAALVETLGRPIEGCHALCIPTAQWGPPDVRSGDATYLCHWMRESGLAGLLPSLSESVWVGMSAGSMVMTPRIGADLVGWPHATNDRTLGVVVFSIFPHLDLFPTNTRAHAERWAVEIGGPAYAIDEQTAIQVLDGSTEVISEGTWIRFG